MFAKVAFSSVALLATNSGLQTISHEVEVTGSFIQMQIQSSEQIQAEVLRIAKQILDNIQNKKDRLKSVNSKFYDEHTKMIELVVHNEQLTALQQQGNQKEEEKMEKKVQNWLKKVLLSIFKDLKHDENGQKLILYQVAKQRQHKFTLEGPMAFMKYSFDDNIKILCKNIGEVEALLKQIVEQKVLLENTREMENKFIRLHLGYGAPDDEKLSKDSGLRKMWYENAVLVLQVIPDIQKDMQYVDIAVKRTNGEYGMYAKELEASYFQSHIYKIALEKDTMLQTFRKSLDNAETLQRIEMVAKDVSPADVGLTEQDFMSLITAAKTRVSEEEMLVDQLISRENADNEKMRDNMQNIVIDVDNEPLSREDADNEKMQYNKNK